MRPANLDWALAYVRSGRVVLPLWPETKAPHASKKHPTRALLGAGFKLAEVGSSDEAQVTEWWTREPNAGIGIVCGVRSRLVIIDVDTKNQGEFAWEAERTLWASEGLELPEGPLVRTPSGGYHLWFALPEDVDVRSWDGWLPGVDVLGTGHWAAVPPTFVRDVDRAYEYVRAGQLPLAPAWFLEKITKATLRRRRSTMNPVEDGIDLDAVTTERFNWTRALQRGAVPVGEQNRTLLGAAGSCRARRHSDDVALAMLIDVVNCFTNDVDREPWTEQHAHDIWERVKDTYEPGITGVELTSEQRAYRPQLTLIRGEGGSDNGQDPPENDHPAAGEPPAPPAPPEDPDDFDPGDDPQGRNTDRDNAYELVRRYGDRICWTPAQGWWVYDGVRWERDTRQQLVRYVEIIAERIRLIAPEGEEGEAQRRRANRLDMVAGVKATLAYAEGLCAIRDEDLDSHRLLLNLPNGTLNLATGQLQEHRAGDLLTRCAGVEYDSDATSPLLDEYLATFMPDPHHQEAMFRLLGVCLEGRNDRRILVMLIGNTTSGKSQLASGLERCLGDYVGVGAASIFRGNLDDRPRPDIIKLLTARVALLEEAGQSWELHGDRIKHLTGGGTVTVRAMRSDNFIDRVPDFTPVIIANEMPRVKSADEATQRRMRVIPFVHRPPIEDPLKKVAFLESDECMRALLARIVAGYVAAQARGVEDLPHDFNLATVEAFSAMDDVQEFVSWAVETGKLIHDVECSGRDCVASSELHEAYVTWVRKHGDAVQRRDQVGLKTFSQRLKAMGWEPMRVNGSRWKSWKFVDPQITWRP